MSQCHITCLGFKHAPNSEPLKHDGEASGSNGISAEDNLRNNILEHPATDKLKHTCTWMFRKNQIEFFLTHSILRIDVTDGCQLAYRHFYMLLYIITILTSKEFIIKIFQVLKEDLCRNNIIFGIATPWNMPLIKLLF